MRLLFATLLFSLTLLLGIAYGVSSEKRNQRDGTTEEKGKDQGPWGSISDVGMFALTGALFVVSVIQIVLWDTSNKTSKRALRQAKKANKAAKDANEATKASNEIADTNVKAFIESERGRIILVAPILIGGPLKVGERIAVKGHIVNVGRTAAECLLTCGRLYVANDRLKGEFSGDEIFVSNNWMRPYSEGQNGATGSIDIFSLPLTNDLLTAINNRNISIILDALLIYRTAQGMYYGQRMCFTYHYTNKEFVRADFGPTGQEISEDTYRAFLDILKEYTLRKAGEVATRERAEMKKKEGND
ncbi:MAG: hypothetical protein IPJ76_14175 [Flavobacteriales bacterium]|nr:MAG: hypothetical protein IPJ76_14175 [Flavobacteriales bacterium]